MNQITDTPLMWVLDKFTSSKVPLLGLEEIPISEPFWQIGTEGTPTDWPGEGLARYPMLYIGEGCNRIYVIDGGKVVWTYDTGLGNELDDIWMLKNGNILFSRMYWAGEVTPEKKLVWRYEAKPGEELHTIQAIGPDRVLMVVNSTAPQPYCVIINKATGKEEYRHDVPYDVSKGVHGQFRRFRITAAGTFLVPCLCMSTVVEYDKEFNEIWRYDVNSPWAAVRLLNGNTLITNEKDKETIEVSPDKEIVWRYGLSDMPEKYRLFNCQSVVRLKNGNTIFCSRGNKGLAPQLVEVTKDKQLVWVLKDWRQLGPATTVQILNDPGDPEVPGECER